MEHAVPVAAARQGSKKSALSTLREQEERAVCAAGAIAAGAIAAPLERRCRSEGSAPAMLSPSPPRRGSKGSIYPSRNAVTLAEMQPMIVINN